MKLREWQREALDHDKTPFISFKQFCEYRLPYGMALKWDVLLKISEKTKYREIILAQEVLDEPLAHNGEIGKYRSNLSYGITIAEKSQNTASYILRRLARDGAEDASKAELFKQVTKGTISAHKAALEAGYRTKKTPLETVKTIIARLETEDVKAILEYLKEQLKTRR